MLREMFWNFQPTTTEQTNLAGLLRSAGITLPGNTFDTDTVNQILQNNETAMDNGLTIGKNSSDSAIAYAMYSSRNKSLTDIADKLTSTNTKTSQAYQSEKETATRQVEINTWEYENKMDTLFFLQVLFIALCISAVSLYLRHSFILSGGVAFGIIGISILVAVLVLLNRWIFTTRMRDKRYWNRQYIPASKSLSSDINKCV